MWAVRKVANCGTACPTMRSSNLQSRSRRISLAIWRRSGATECVSRFYCLAITRFLILLYVAAGTIFFVTSSFFPL